jgi:hypothetical protein
MQGKSRTAALKLVGVVAIKPAHNETTGGIGFQDFLDKSI